MNKFKAISTREYNTYVIKAEDYLEFIEYLNKRKRIIFRIAPTYVATNISDSFVINTINKT